jgi:hypothetical protein
VDPDQVGRSASRPPFRRSYPEIRPRGLDRQLAVSDGRYGLENALEVLTVELSDRIAKQ